MLDRRPLENRSFVTSNVMERYPRTAGVGRGTIGFSIWEAIIGDLTGLLNEGREDIAGRQQEISNDFFGPADHHGDRLLARYHQSVIGDARQQQSRRCGSLIGSRPEPAHRVENRRRPFFSAYGACRTSFSRRLAISNLPHLS
jgi:hypothetical protein